MAPATKRSKTNESPDAAVPPTSKAHRFMDAPPADPALLKLVDKLLEEKGKGSVKMLVRYMTDAASDGCTGPVKELHLHSKTEIDQLILMNSATAEGPSHRHLTFFQTRSSALCRGY